MPRRMRTPGPGAYDVPGWQTMSGGGEVRSPSPTASFRSTSARSSAVRSGDPLGDPGAYDDTGAGPKASLAARSRESFNRSASGGAASFDVRSGRAGSAPRSSARGGPGEHDFGHLYRVGQASTQVSSPFKSSVGGNAGHIRKIDTPGIGTYDPYDGPLGRSVTHPDGVTSMSRAGHSMFAGATSRSKSPASRRTDPQVGPGTYYPTGPAASMLDDMQSSRNERLPGFNSSVPRLASAARERARSPAPGDYDDFARRTVAATSARTFNRSGSSGDAAFYTRSPRKGTEATNSGDPGAYIGPFDSPGVHKGGKEMLSGNTQRSFNRDAHAGRDSFTSRSARSAREVRSTRGGPGEHDYRHLFETGREYVSTQVSSSFKSNLPLAGHIRKSDTPGVGTYDPVARQDNLGGSMSKAGQSMFAGAHRQHADLADTNRTDVGVGPGTYDPEGPKASIYDKAIKARNARLPGFNSSAPRYDDDIYDA